MLRTHFDAEQCLAGGSSVNVQIQSLTNDIHGSGFWYSNKARWNARRSDRVPIYDPVTGIPDGA